MPASSIKTDARCYSKLALAELVRIALPILFSKDRVSESLLGRNFRFSHSFQTFSSLYKTGLIITKNLYAVNEIIVFRLFCKICENSVIFRQNCRFCIISHDPVDNFILHPP